MNYVLRYEPYEEPTVKNVGITLGLSYIEHLTKRKKEHANLKNTYKGRMYKRLIVGLKCAI